MTHLSFDFSKQEAEQYGNVEEVQVFQQQIDDLEARASELERRRSQSIRGISWINQRNRQAIKEAILSGQIQIETANQDDPFTRKNARMKPVSGKDKIYQQTNENMDSVGGSAGDRFVRKTISQKELTSVGREGSSSGPVSDLFNAHNFDVDIDIAIPVAAMTVTSISSSINSTESNLRQSESGSSRAISNRGSSRPISLEDYKRRKGLI
ncbi:unnamed protein product [Thelazia callipaeda]|uniref:Uncharacterized protein n=1 Tax=Thelazia callipaeda TaxID=103827 RepID=A0A0N5D6U2_THECL|nr:unnamed protein product [Thelazia callipaeda]